VFYSIVLTQCNGVLCLLCCLLHSGEIKYIYINMFFFLCTILSSRYTYDNKKLWYNTICLKYLSICLCISDLLIMYISTFCYRCGNYKTQGDNGATRKTEV